MDLQLPEFAEGIHYEILRGGEFRFRLLCDISITFPFLHGSKAEVSFRDHMGREWVRQSGAKMTARKGYAWNGASPCWWVPVIGWVGTPTPHPCRLPTLWHDIPFQFMWTQHWPKEFDISVANEVFFTIMRLNKFRFANTYYGAVNDFGKRFIGKYPRRGEHSFIFDQPIA